jgi:hypothetical protein
VHQQLKFARLGNFAFDFSLSDRYLVADHDERHPKLRWRFSLGTHLKQVQQYRTKKRNWLEQAAQFDDAMAIFMGEWNVSCSKGAE